MKSNATIFALVLVISSAAITQQAVAQEETRDETRNRVEKAQDNKELRQDRGALADDKGDVLRLETLVTEWNDLRRRGVDPTRVDDVAGRINAEIWNDIRESEAQIKRARREVGRSKSEVRSDRREIRYEHLVSSMPLVKLLDACGRPWDPAVYSWNRVLVFNLGFDRKGQSRDHWLYVPERDYCFYRVGFYDNIFQTDRMSLYVEIGLPADGAPVDVDAWRDRVLVDLERIGICEGHELVSSHSVVLDPAYVHITTRSKTEAETQRQSLADHGIHSIGRYGGWTYCAIEDNIVEARELAGRLLG